MKTPRPWYRKQNDTWYVCRRGKQVPLCKGKDNKPEAERHYFRLMAASGDALPEPATLTVARVADLFLDWSQRHNAPSTYAWYRDFLQDFCDLYGGVLALQLKPLHVTRWLDRHDAWHEGSQRAAVTCLKRAYNWAEAQGVLPANPVKKVAKPAARSRDRVLSREERLEILAFIKDQPFRDLVTALQETGCRPSEVARVTAADVDLGLMVWTLRKHKTGKKTGKPRVVYLTPPMVELTRALMEKHPDGPLFLNRRGRAWTRNAIRCRFRRIREKLPHLRGVVSYSYRHSFATDALVNGVGAVEVAELMGHSNTDMLVKHYQHLAGKRQHMLKAAVTARATP